jgi:putative zinc-binding metallo-peptidase
MSRRNTLALLDSWETVRCELLHTRICDLGISIESSPVEGYLNRLYREMAGKGLSWRPEAYLSDSWGCPDRVPVIGIPFYLADRRLARIEEEQTGEIESSQGIMMLLRHEAGHAINYAYRLYKRQEWTNVFGSFSQPYKENFRPNPLSRHFVRHIEHHRHGRTYAQKHPDEDFAETFAVWLTPRSGWRRHYRNWPALRKLKCVDQLVRMIRDEDPHCTRGSLCTPVEKMELLLAEHYGQRAQRYRDAAQGFVDDKLREVFPPVRGRVLTPAGELLRKHRPALVRRVTRWSGMAEDEAAKLLDKLEERAMALDLHFRLGETSAKIMDVTALTTALAMDFVYAERLTG